jgi:hypothetical protein
MNDINIINGIQFIYVQLHLQKSIIMGFQIPTTYQLSLILKF